MRAFLRSKNKGGRMGDIGSKVKEFVSESDGSIEGNDGRYLVFRLSSELYATPLLGVREVVESYSPKPIPNTPIDFSGVVDIRGEVVGVIDLRRRFNQGDEDSPQKALIVFSTDSGPMAGLVDQVEAVITLDEGSIESKANIGADFKNDCVIGIGKSEKRLITLVDLHKVLESYGVSCKKLTA